MKKYVVTVNGNRYEVEVEEVQGDFSSIPTAVTSVESRPVAAPVKKAAPAAKKPSAEGEKIEAPMPGNIFKVNVKPGDSFKAGDVLFILEAMKMENEIKAPRDGKVIEVGVEVGAQVDTGDVLAVIE